MTVSRRTILATVSMLPLAALPIPESLPIYPAPDALERFPAGDVMVDGVKCIQLWWLPMWLQTEEERGKRLNNCLFPPGHPLRYVREAFPSEPYKPGTKQIGDVRWV